MDLLWIVIFLAAGSLMLYFGSDWLVRGAKGLAMRLGIAPFIIGLTVVAFGSSAPEAITSIVSASHPELIVGNVVGSNIANVGLAIGLAAIVGPMAAVYRSMRLELFTMLIASFALLGLALLDIIDFYVGLVLIASLFVFLAVVFKMKASDEEGKAAYVEEVTEETLTTPFLAILVFIGLVLLYFGAKYFVEGAVGLAEMLGVPDLIVGLIVVAIGTSLPEICISLIAARRGEADLAVANIVGSNIFNIMFVLGIGASLTKIPVSDSLIMFHIPFMIILAIAMFLFVRFRNRIDRLAGGVFVGIYVVYIALIALYPSLMI